MIFGVYNMKDGVFKSEKLKGKRKEHKSIQNINKTEKQIDRYIQNYDGQIISQKQINIEIDI